MKLLSRNHDPDYLDLANDLYYYKLKSRALQVIALNILLRFLQKIFFQ